MQSTVPLADSDQTTITIAQVLLERAREELEEAQAVVDRSVDAAAAEFVDLACLHLALGLEQLELLTN